MLCKKLGAGYAVSEMVTSKRELWSTLKTSRRANHDGESAPIAVQIAGTSADMMAEAALYNVDNGAQIIDINMGCPAKKVCNKWAGSALMQDEGLALSSCRRSLCATQRSCDFEDANGLVPKS
jgi:tRNA-dihydrouridine synthase B